ncbi:MAG: hypothetical protein IKP47_05070 [Ruminococcus sp.]|nr:hypothetical protein [Ruminococcus sp.]
MKVKKILAGLASVAVAMSAMSMAAFAADEVDGGSVAVIVGDGQGEGEGQGEGDGQGEPAEGSEEVTLHMVGDEEVFSNKAFTITVAENEWSEEHELVGKATYQFDYADYADLIEEFGDNFRVVLVATDIDNPDVKLAAQVFLQSKEDWSGWDSVDAAFVQDAGYTCTIEGATADLVKDLEAKYQKSGIEIRIDNVAELGLQAGDKVNFKLSYALFSDATPPHDHGNLNKIGDKLVSEDVEMLVKLKDGEFSGEGEFVFPYTTWAEFEAEFGTKYCIELAWEDSDKEGSFVTSLDAQVYTMQNPGWTWESNYGIFNIAGGKAITTETTPTLNLNGDTSALLVHKAADNELGRAGIQFLAHLDPDKLPEGIEEGDTFTVKISCTLFSDGKVAEPTQEPTDQPTEEPTKTDDDKPAPTGAAAGALAALAVVGAGAVLVSKKRK